MSAPDKCPRCGEAECPCDLNTCPNCGSALSTWKTRHVGELIRRKRDCKASGCGYREAVLVRPEKILAVKILATSSPLTPSNNLELSQ